MLQEAAGVGAGVGRYGTATVGSGRLSPEVAGGWVGSGVGTGVVIRVIDWVVGVGSTGVGVGINQESVMWQFEH